MDLEVRKRQKTINRLLDELGLMCVLVSLCLLTGCVGPKVNIPDEELLAHSESLESGEKTYRIDGRGVTTKDGKLYGDWYLVSKEYMREHRDNQDNLLKSLTLLKTERTKTKYLGWSGIVLGVLGFILGFRTRNKP
jgi:hypothetical protein